ncbi:MAG TPA: DUF47 family protein [Actinomycetota bacterium]|jgi:predicted phosphate transport protein (TIGR00153 family)|nr:DUF47 family protein [Actinomycetota bacterium]
MPRVKLLPSGEHFFDMLEALAAKVDEGAMLLTALLGDYTNVERKVQRIVDTEHEADEITHQIMRGVSKSHFAPFSRGEIIRLASALDDVLDYVQGAAEDLYLCRIQRPLPAMVQQAETLSRATRATVGAMPRLRQSGRLWVHLRGYFSEAERLEREGDRLYRQTIAELYGSDHYGAMDVLKYEGIITGLEEALDRVEDVANTIETIALQNQ